MDDQHLPLHFPRGVLNPDGTKAYIANASGGISAIELSTGTVLWSTSEARRTLIVIGDRLIAMQVQQTHALQVVVFDTTRSGMVTLISDSVVFPEWVTVDLQNTENFALSARGRDKILLLDWEARTFYRGGAAPSQQILQQESRYATGTAQIDLGTGHVTMLPRADEAQPVEEPRPAPVPPTLEQGARDVQVLGTRAYYIVDEHPRPGVSRIVLRAADLALGRIIWELPLEEQRTSRPPPLRQ